jgi:hypothetical protein
VVGFWLSLALLLVASAAGLAFATVRGLQFYRSMKRTGGEFSSRLDRISDTVASIETQLAAADASVQRLTEAGTRLPVSRARLGVQLAAVQEARALVRRVFWFVPGV